jgi:excisionase family DNA binding protein
VNNKVVKVVKSDEKLVQAMEEELLTAKELARYLKVSPRTVLRRARNGELPAIRVGKRFRFNKKQVDRWLSERTVSKPVEILVIDDEPVIGELLRASLGMCGYRVTTTTSSRQGLELVAARRFDLIFLDLVMPELDGSEVFRRIREVDRDTTVAIVTAYSDSELMKKAMEYGPFLVIRKPFAIVEVIEAVRSLTGRPGVEQVGGKNFSKIISNRA